MPPMTRALPRSRSRSPSAVRLRLERTGQVDYQVERHNSDWPDHLARTNVTAGLIAWLQPGSVLDPACGDASIDFAAARLHGFEARLGDISQPNVDAVAKSMWPGWSVVLGDALTTIARSGKADVVVLTEILEHVEDPDSILRAARKVGGFLVASSPMMRDRQVDTNEEHLWQFDQDGYLEMLVQAGWQAFNKTIIYLPAFQYDFGVWVAQ